MIHFPLGRAGRRLALAAALTVPLALGAGPALAHGDERVDHYEARESATLQEAIANFSEYNTKLAEVLARSELGASDFEEVHELTYTLENALAKIRDDLGGLADTLEALHLASEDHTLEETLAYGEAYLETAQTLVP